MNIFGRNGGVAALVLNLGNRWRWVVSLMLRPLHALEKEFPVTVEQECEWTWEPTFLFWRRVKKKLSLALRRCTGLFTSICRVSRTRCVQLQICLTESNEIVLILYILPRSIRVPKTPSCSLSRLRSTNARTDAAMNYSYLCCACLKKLFTLKVIRRPPTAGSLFHIFKFENYFHFSSGCLRLPTS